MAAQLQPLRIKIAFCIEHIIAQKFIERTVQAIGSALGHSREHTTSITAILGGKARGQHLEFLNALNRRIDNNSGVAPLRIVHAIEQEAGVIATSAINSE